MPEFKDKSELGFITYLIVAIIFLGISATIFRWTDNTFWITIGILIEVMWVVVSYFVK